MDPTPQMWWGTFLRAGKCPGFLTKTLSCTLGWGIKKDGKELKLWRINSGAFHQQLKSENWNFSLWIIPLFWIFLCAVFSSWKIEKKSRSIQFPLLSQPWSIFSCPLQWIPPFLVPCWQTGWVCRSKAEFPELGFVVFPSEKAEWDRLLLGEPTWRLPEAQLRFPPHQGALRGRALPSPQQKWVFHLLIIQNIQEFLVNIP